MADPGLFSTQQEPTRNDSVAVGTSAVTVANARMGVLPRKVISLRNISPSTSDTITVWFSPQAGSVAVNTGIVLRQNESVTDSTDSGYECWQGSISALCATANGILAVFER